MPITLVRSQVCYTHVVPGGRRVFMARISGKTGCKQPTRCSATCSRWFRTGCETSLAAGLVPGSGVGRCGGDCSPRLTEPSGKAGTYQPSEAATLSPREIRQHCWCRHFQRYQTRSRSLTCILYDISGSRSPRFLAYLPCACSDRSYGAVDGIHHPA